MSVECGECEHDLRGGHGDSCSRAQRCDACGSVVSHTNVTPAGQEEGIARICQCGKQRVYENEDEG